MKNDHTKSAADQGLAAGTVMAFGCTAVYNGWVVSGIFLSIFGALIYLETQTYR